MVLLKMHMYKILLKYNHKGIIKDIQIVNNDLLYLNEQLQMY